MVEKCKIVEFTDFLVLETAVLLIFLYMYRKLVFGPTLLNGDMGIFDLNASLLHQLSASSPWNNLFATFIYDISPLVFNPIYNSFNLFLVLTMPIGSYFLLKQLNFGRFPRFVGSFFYTMNPLTLTYSLGPEYTVLLFFLPLIAGYLYKYSNTWSRRDPIAAGFLSYLLLDLNGVSEIKYLFILYLPFLIYILIRKSETRNRKKLIDLGVTFIIIFLLSLPLIFYLIQRIFVFSNSLATDSLLIPNEISIVKYVFSSSNLLVSTLMVPYLPSGSLARFDYLSSWFGVLYTILIIASIFNAVVYKGPRKQLYNILLIFLTLLTLFQVGVKNGTLLPIYKIGIFDIYNYPVFFNLEQLVIYTILFAQVSEFIQNYGIDTNLRLLVRSKLILRSLKSVTMLFVIVLVLLSVFPILHHNASTSSSTAQKIAVPDYVFNLTNSLKSDQNYSTLILPSNATTLNYLDMAIPYQNVYGLPYNYQAFASDFPKQSVFYNLSMAFANSNVTQISNILLSQNVVYVVVLNPQNHAPISAGKTRIEGGGYYFAKLMNKSNSFNQVQGTKSFLIYKFNGNNLINPTITNVTGISQNINYTYKYEKMSDKPTIVSGKNSHIAIPINITVPGNINRSSNLVYDQKIFLSTNLSNEINSNFSNILFMYVNDSFIPAWIQNISTSGAIIFLKLHGEINRTIFLNIYSQNEILFSKTGFLGEAPQLSGIGANGVLPSYIVYSTIAFGVYGYGILNSSALTLNFSFNPSLFQKIENKNLSNLELFTLNGTKLKSSLVGIPTNKSTLAIISISFPGGTTYFKSESKNYNFFYLGFAQNSVDLNALHSNISYTTGPVMSIGYDSNYVKDYGTYGKYDNGKVVFNAYSDYFSTTNGLGDSWEYLGPTPGYGFIACGTYSPFVTEAYSPFILKPGEIGMSYGNITGFGSTSSLAAISSNKNASLFGNVNISSMDHVFSNQEQTTQIGWSTNGTYGQVFGASNYNDSSRYIYSQFTRGFATKGFQSYGLYLKNNDKVLLYFNGTYAGQSNLSNVTKAYFILSVVSNGGFFNSYYSLAMNAPLNDTMPSYVIGRKMIAQAYFNGLREGNPTDVNEPTIYIVYTIGNYSSGSYIWTINNKSFVGNDSSTLVFNKLGIFEIRISVGSKYTTLNVSVVSDPTIKTFQVSNGIGDFNKTFSVEIENGTGEYYFLWYINGYMLQQHTSIISYTFAHGGSYIISVAVADSSGSVSKYSNISIFVNYKTKNTGTSLNWYFVIYNTFGTMFGVVYFPLIYSGKSRKFVSYILKRS